MTTNFYRLIQTEDLDQWSQYIEQYTDHGSPLQSFNSLNEAICVKFMWLRFIYTDSTIEYHLMFKSYSEDGT